MVDLDFTFGNYVWLFGTAFLVGTLMLLVSPAEESAVSRSSTISTNKSFKAKRIKDVEKLPKKFSRKSRGSAATTSSSSSETTSTTTTTTTPVRATRERREIGAGRGPGRSSRGRGGRGPSGRRLGPKRNINKINNNRPSLEDDDESSSTTSAPSRQKSALQAERSSRFSTLNWLGKFARSDGTHLNSNYDLKSSRSLHASMTTGGKRPINILCMDGGGAKGFTLAAVIEDLESDLGTPIAAEFDLVAGTSIGGVAALMCNYFPGYGEANRNCIAFGRMITGGVFKNLNLFNLLNTGAIFDGKDNRREVLKKIFGRYTPIKNERLPKAFCVATYDNAGSLQPYLMRTYETPEEIDDLKVADGTCQCRMWEAGVATSAAPVAFGRLEIFTGEDETLKLVDGCLVANDPTELALYEAMALYPGHPIGLVISVGTGRPTKQDDGSAPKGIEQKIKDAGGEYIRINPIIGNVSPAESDPDRLTELQMNVLEFMEEAPEAAWARKRLKESAAARQERLEKEGKRLDSDYLVDDDNAGKFSSILGRISEVRNSVRASLYGAASEVKRRTSYALGRNSGGGGPMGSSPSRPTGRKTRRKADNTKAPNRNSSMANALAAFTSMYGETAEDDEDVVDVTENNEEEEEAVEEIANNPAQDTSESQRRDLFESHREEDDEDSSSSDEKEGPPLSIEKIIRDSQAKVEEATENDQSKVNPPLVEEENEETTTDETKANLPEEEVVEEPSEKGVSSAVGENPTETKGVPAAANNETEAKSADEVVEEPTVLPNQDA